jgi:hypothetical protein
VGTADQLPETDTDRSLTQWLMGDFLRQLQAAESSPALDYLKGVFDHLLDLPAWTVSPFLEPCEAHGQPIQPDSDQLSSGTFMVTGREVRKGFLDNLTEAASELLASAPQAWNSESADHSPAEVLAMSDKTPVRAGARSASPIQQNLDVLGFMVSLQRKIPIGIERYLNAQGGDEAATFARALLRQVRDQNYRTTEAILLPLWEKSRTDPSQLFKILEAIQSIIADASLEAARAAVEAATPQTPVPPAQEAQQSLGSPRRETGVQELKADTPASSPSANADKLTATVSGKVEQPRRQENGLSCRLKLCGDTLALDGKEISLELTADKRKDILQFFRALLGAPRGDWVSGMAIGQGIRWDRAIAKLPPKLRNLIESKDGTGYRLKTSAWRE